MFCDKKFFGFFSFDYARKIHFPPLTTSSKTTKVAENRQKESTIMSVR